MNYDENDGNIDELRCEMRKVNSEINKRMSIINEMQQDLAKLEYDLATDGLYTRCHEWKRAIEHEIANLEHKLSYEESILTRLCAKQLRLNSELKPSVRPWEREMPLSQTKLTGL